MPDNRATLINKSTEDRKAIEIGSQGEQELFSKGYVLEKTGEAPTQAQVPATYATEGGDRANVKYPGDTTQSALYEKGYTPEVNLYKGALGEDAKITGATSSGTAANNAMNNIGSKINSDLATNEAELEKLKTPEYKEYTDYTSEYEKSREAGKGLWEDRQAAIELDFKTREYDQRQSNRVQTGFASKSLARMGSFGSSASGIDYMKSVQVRNENELTKLIVQKNELLNSAAEAFQAGDLKLLDKLVDENTRVTDKYNEIQTWMFEDALKTNEEARRQQEFGWDKEDRAMEKISTIAASGTDIGALNPDEISKLETDAGLPSGTFESIYNLAQIKTDMEQSKELFSVLNDIPQGQTVEIGGKFYSGMKEGKLTLVTDGKSNKQYALRQNPDGSIEKIDLGIKGKGQPSSATDIELSEMGETITTAFPDGYTDDTPDGIWCGEFIHNLIEDYPPGLNSYEDKAAQIDPGIGMDPEQNPPQVGDVVIQTAPGSEAEPYGHVSVINAFDPETGIMTLTESNWKKTAEGKGYVTNTRQLNVNDKNVSGFFRGQLNEKLTDEIKFEKYASEQIALSVLPTQLKNSEVELKRALDGINQGLKTGLSPYEIADALMGYKISNPSDFSDNMRKYISIGDFDEQKIGEIARLINNGNQEAAVAKIENSMMEYAKKIDPDSYIGEATVKNATQRADTLIDYINGFDVDDLPISVVSGTFEKYIKKRFKGSEETDIMAQITRLTAEMRHKLLGSAVTPSEERYLEPLIPSINDTPENFMIKLEKLKSEPLLELNNIRSTYELPTLDAGTLTNRSERVRLYGGGEQTTAEDDYGLTKSYANINSLLNERPDMQSMIDELKKEYSEEEILQLLSY